MSGFVSGSGTDFSRGDEPAIAAALDKLAKNLGVTIYGISGYRTPSHSVAVGGYADDPHTQAKAADIAVNGQTRASAAQLTDAQLASVGLYRPFPGAAEINHVQLLPAAQQQINAAKAGGPLGFVAGAPSAVGGAVSGAASSVGGAVSGAANAVTGAADDALNAPGNLAGDVAKSLLNDLWDAISGKAEYAGLFLILVLAGAGLAVFGLSRAVGKPQPEAVS